MTQSPSAIRLNLPILESTCSTRDSLRVNPQQLPAGTHSLESPQNISSSLRSLRFPPSPTPSSSSLKFIFPPATTTATSSSTLHSNTSLLSPDRFHQPQLKQQYKQEIFEEIHTQVTQSKKILSKSGKKLFGQLDQNEQVRENSISQLTQQQQLQSHHQFVQQESKKLTNNQSVCVDSYQSASPNMLISQKQETRTSSKTNLSSAKNNSNNNLIVPQTSNSIRGQQGFFPSQSKFNRINSVDINDLNESQANLNTNVIIPSSSSTILNSEEVNASSTTGNLPVKKRMVIKVFPTLSQQIPRLKSERSLTQSTSLKRQSSQIIANKMQFTQNQLTPRKSAGTIYSNSSNNIYNTTSKNSKQTYRSSKIERRHDVYYNNIVETPKNGSFASQIPTEQQSFDGINLKRNVDSAESYQFLQCNEVLTTSSDQVAILIERNSQTIKNISNAKNQNLKSSLQPPQPKSLIHQQRTRIESGIYGQQEEEIGANKNNSRKQIKQQNAQDSDTIDFSFSQDRCTFYWNQKSTAGLVFCASENCTGKSSCNNSIGPITFQQKVKVSSSGAAPEMNAKKSNNLRSRQQDNLVKKLFSLEDKQSQMSVSFSTSIIPSGNPNTRKISLTSQLHQTQSLKLISPLVFPQKKNE